MGKRPSIDLTSLTAEAAAPMAEAAQRRRTPPHPPPCPHCGTFGPARSHGGAGSDPDGELAGAGIQGSPRVPQALPATRRRRRSEAQ